MKMGKGEPTNISRALNGDCWNKRWKMFTNLVSTVNVHIYRTAGRSLALKPFTGLKLLRMSAPKIDWQQKFDQVCLNDLVLQMFNATTLILKAYGIALTTQERKPGKFSAGYIESGKRRLNWPWFLWLTSNSYRLERKTLRFWGDWFQSRWLNNLASTKRWFVKINFICVYRYMLVNFFILFHILIRCWYFNVLWDVCTHFVQMSTNNMFCWYFIMFV